MEQSKILHNNKWQFIPQDISLNQLTSTLVGFFGDFKADLSLQVLIVFLQSSEGFYKVWCNTLFLQTQKQQN